MKDDLGDGVGVEWTGSMYRLHTDRDDRMHEIYLDRSSLIRLWMFVNRIDLEGAGIAIATVRAKE
jgi:hypothetical protein